MVGGGSGGLRGARCRPRGRRRQAAAGAPLVRGVGGRPGRRRPGAARAADQGRRARSRSRRPGDRDRSALPRREALRQMQMQIDVFTLFPPAFAWFEAQRHVTNAIAAGSRIEYVNYRDHTPLSAGQVDDTPFGGGAGMVLRVDVVEAALRDAIAAGSRIEYVNYRDHTPLSAGQVDDTPFGGGAGMVLRVDVVEAAL